LYGLTQLLRSALGVGGLLRLLRSALGVGGLLSLLCHWCCVVGKVVACSGCCWVPENAWCCICYLLLLRRGQNRSLHVWGLRSCLVLCGVWSSALILLCGRFVAALAVLSVLSSALILRCGRFVVVLAVLSVLFCEFICCSESVAPPAVGRRCLLPQLLV